MSSESFAELLFFARAAVEADPALANTRIDAPLGRVSIQGRPDRPDDPPLAIAGLYRVWDDHAVQVPCPRCGAPRLFLDASGGGMHRPVAFVHRLLERKRALFAPVRPEVLGRELDDALVRDAEARLGQRLEPFARALFLAAVESAAADPGGGADTLAVLGAAVAPDAGPG